MQAGFKLNELLSTDIQLWQLAVVLGATALLTRLCFQPTKHSNVSDHKKVQLELSKNNESLARRARSEGTKLVLVVCGDLGLAKGTVAVECARATLECYKRAQSEVPGVLTVWEREGQAKVTLKCTGAEMAQLWQQAENAGLVASNNEKMVLGIGPGPISLINTVSGHLKLY